MPTITLKDTDAYATAAKYHPGVQAGLKAALIAGVSAERSTRNMAEGGAAFTPSGVPAVNAKDAVYGAGAWLDTPILETADCTYYAIFKPCATGRGSIIGNYEVNGPWGAALFMETGGVMQFHVGIHDGNGGSVQRLPIQINGYAATTLAAASWRLIRAECDSANRTISLTDLTSGNAPVTSNWGGTSVRDLRDLSRTLRIGAGHLATFRANQQIMAVLDYSRVLTAAEKAKVEGRLRALAAYCGANV